MGIIDMVRVKDEDFFHVNTDANRVHHVDTPVGLSHRYFRQTKGRWRGMKIEGGLGWKGDGVNDVAHEELPGVDRTITFFKNSLIGALEGLQVTEACDCPEQK